MTDDRPDDPRSAEPEDLLARWIWNPTDLTPAELEVLESSPELRARMEELRQTERALRAVSDREREQAIQDALQGATSESHRTGGTSTFDDTLEQLRRAPPTRPVQPMPALGPSRWRRVLIPAAAAAILVAVWGFGALNRGADDMPLGDSELVAEWDPQRGRVAWRGRPSAEGTIRLRVSADDFSIERVFYEGESEWQEAGFSLDRGLIPDEFTFEVRFESLRGLVEKKSRPQTVRWP